MMANHNHAPSGVCELLDYMREHAASIYVREEIGGKRGNYAISDLPAARALYWASQWIRKQFPEIELKAYLREIGEANIPKIKESAFVLGLMMGDPDPQQCLQIGAALLLEKPLILVSVRGAWIPPKLRRLADAVVEIESMDDPQGKERLATAISDLMQRMGLLQ